MQYLYSPAFINNSQHFTYYSTFSSHLCPGYKSEHIYFSPQHLLNNNVIYIFSQHFGS
jgi:hypothetical protein